MASKRTDCKIIGYGVSACAGRNSSEVLQSLQKTNSFQKKDDADRLYCIQPDKFESLQNETSCRERLHSYLRESLFDAQEKCTDDWKEHSYGIIFCSTKGELEDFIEREPESKDPCTEVLNSFIEEGGLNPSLKLVISNACASGLSGLSLGKKWIEQGRVDSVIVLGADLVGKFVLSGFSALGAMSEDRVRSFGLYRDGLVLGEGGAALILSGLEKENSKIRLVDAAVELVGDSATRPTEATESLKRIYQNNFRELKSPDWIIAHGTATKLNDRVEEKAYWELFGEFPYLTASKGVLGHTLGASSLIDSALACEIIVSQEGFPIANTEVIDPSFQSRIVTEDRFEESKSREIKNVLVGALGFGNIHSLGYFQRFE